jgi:hypothetical protein
MGRAPEPVKHGPGQDAFLVRGRCHVMLVRSRQRGVGADPVNVREDRMDKRVILGCLMALAVGCGGGTTPGNDSGVTPPTDGGGNDVGSTQMVLAVADPDTIDLTCLGTATRPMGGAATMATLSVTEYVSMMPVTATTVELYNTDAITGTCASPDCAMGTTDSMGHASLMAPAGGWVAVHLLASADTAEVLAYNQTWPTTGGATFATAAFSSSSIGLVSSLLGRTFDSAHAGAISGQVNDCMDHNIANAEARVFHGTTQVVTGASSDRSSPRITGLMGTSPTRAPGLTGSGGTFVGANVPPGDDYHVEIWGITTAGGSPELVGCEEGRVVAGAITVLVIGPLRSDYAAGSACATAAAAAHH